MEWIAITVAVLFTLLGLACLLAVLLSLPGTWILLGLAVIVELADGTYLPGEEPVTFGWLLLGICTGLAVLGEVIETGAGAAGAKLGGATRRGVIGAIVGGIAGAILFTPLIPIPVVGTLLGALIGTFLGAFLGEVTSERQRHPNETLQAALAAAVGRLAGTLGKLGVGIVIWILLTFAAFRL
jgi:uncharacterized protein YqgC (DUF456 family)